jgi:hypothetical protein
MNEATLNCKYYPLPRSFKRAFQTETTYEQMLYWSEV